MGFHTVKKRLLEALRAGTFMHEARHAISSKNLLLMGEVTVSQVIHLVNKCTGLDHQSAPHHFLKNIEIHILKKDGWYIKFYILEPDVWFISVHQ